MPTFYGESEPNILKDEKGNVSEIHHNHCTTIDYKSFGKSATKELNQLIDQQKVALKGCITFFQTVVDDKKIDGLARASAASALEEDKARLKDFEDHKRSSCAIM